MVTVSFRTSDQTKIRAVKLFQDLGLDMSSVINLFLRQSIASNDVPFTPHRGSTTNTLAKTETETRTGAYFDSVTDLMADLNVADQDLPHQSVRTRR